jgi:hypothetical protein
MGAGPFGLFGSPETTNVVVNVTNGFLIWGGDWGGFSGYQNAGSITSFASEYTRIEDNLDLGEFGEFRSNGPIQVAGWLRASDRVTLHSGLDGTGDLTFETHLDPFSGSVSLVDVWAGTIALRAGSNTGLAGARVDALTNTPSFHGAAGGATRPASFALEQDRPVVDADRPATSQFGASTSGMAYRLESYDSSVTINDEDGLGGTVLALASETGSTVNAPLSLASMEVFGSALLNADVASTGSQRYFGSVEVDGLRTLSASDALFASTLDSAAPGNSDLSIVAGSTRFEGAVGAERALGSLIVSGASAIAGGSVTTLGDQRYDGAVVIEQNTVLRATDVARAGVVRFGSTVDAASTPDLGAVAGRNLDVGTTTAGLIVFADDVGGVGPLGSVRLHTDVDVSQRPIPERATIVGENSLSIRADSFEMGQHEKFTTLGDLDLRATTSATLGDVTTVGNMTVEAPDIRVLRRAASTLTY